MQAVGAVFREMVDGLMAILRGRSELKSQLRVSATTLKPVDNNPLKFSRIVDDALKQMLTTDQPGFMKPTDAVRAGFTDIMNHQLAMTAAIQAAVIALLEHFDPQHFDRQNGDGVLFKRKAKSWDAFQRSYAEIANDALENFFGEAFTHAYEEQIRKLQGKKDDN
jgi:type VI secretion system protein